MSTRRRSRGFSLLEAVAALALLGLALPAILSTFADVVSRASRAEDRVDNLRRAQNLVTLARAQFHGEKEVRSGLEGDTTWKVEAIPLDPGARETRRGSSDPILVQLSVTVRSRRGAETRLDTMFLFHEARR